MTMPIRATSAALRVTYHPGGLFIPEIRPARLEVFRRLLAGDAGTNADARAIAASARRMLARFSAQMIPIIGACGAAAVYGRSVYLAQRQVPWLPLAPADESFTGV